MKVSRAAVAVDVAFDDPNLIADAGLAPVVALFVDDHTGQLVSDAEVAEIGYTAFTSHPTNKQVTGRLIVRRVKRCNANTEPGQDGLFDVWRYHAVFVTSDFEMLQAESRHRDRAIIEQVIADAAASALAHLPRGLSQPTRPGRCCGRSRTTSHAPPVP